MIEIGIVGKPNVGKSTLFSALTSLEVPIANYPFTTIDANIGIGYVRTKCVCREFNVTDNPRNSICIDGNRFIPVKIIDTAGLVPDAWKGRGLGNRFLNKISMSDIIIHVIDLSGSTDIEGRPIKPGEHDPLEDIIFLKKELIMWIFKILERNWDSVRKSIEYKRLSIEESIANILSGLKITVNQVKEALTKTGLDTRNINPKDKDNMMFFLEKLLEFSKPIILAGNKIDYQASEKNLEYLNSEGYKIIPISALSELVLNKLSNQGIIKYLPGDKDFEVVNIEKLNDKQRRALKMIHEKIFRRFGGTGVQDLINYSIFDVLNMIVVYPVRDPIKLSDKNGNILPDAYLIKSGTRLKEFAYLVHTELGDKLLYGINVRKGLRIGSDYVLRNNDVVSFVTVS